jgi:hypothetical protein
MDRYSTVFERLFQLRGFLVSTNQLQRKWESPVFTGFCAFVSTSSKEVQDYRVDLNGWLTRAKPQKII